MKLTNALIDETSPYLKQHANDPVEWVPWSERAFKQARKEKKLVFLSVGYFTCHWCHVLQHESFQDPDIAEALNNRYISIKVDREERPDIDQFYQTANQLMGRSGGWPLSIFLTPDKEIVFSGTYFPPEPRFGIPSFPEVIINVHRAYERKKTEIAENAKNIQNAIENSLTKIMDDSYEIEEQILIDAIDNIIQHADYTHGGFGRQPKFPTTPTLSFLIRALAFTDPGRKGSILQFLKLTLRKLANGGIHDHLEGGFHRYSVDNEWKVPHFEKMLYDNAQLAVVYFQFFQITNDSFYKDIGIRTLDYITQRLISSTNGFFTAEDADSEGVEGRYYSWSSRDIEKALESELKQEIAASYYSIDPKNQENTLIITKSPQEIAEEFDLAPDEVNIILESLKVKLLKYRELRERPARDDKILTNLTSLTISAFCYGYRVTKAQNYLETAQKAFEFVITQLWNPPILFHSYTEGKARIIGFLDDYAYFLKATLDLYSVDPIKRYLEVGKQLLKIIIEDFWDNNDGGVYFVSKLQKDTLSRIKGAADNASPSATGVLSECFSQLAIILNDIELLNLNEKIISMFLEEVKTSNTIFYGAYLQALDLFIHKPLEISFHGDLTNPNLIEIIDYLHSIYIPWQVISPSSSTPAPVTSSKPHALICHSFTCSKPIESLIEFKDALKVVLEQNIINNLNE